MPSFDQIRQMYPDAKDASDEQIILRTQELTGLPLEQVVRDFDFKMPKSDMGKEWEAAKSNYAAGMQHIGGALGSSTMKDWAEQNEARAKLMQSQSNVPHSYKDVEFGDKDKGVLNYLGGLAIGSAPFIAEQAAFTAGDVLTGGALTPIHATRLGMRVAESGIAAKSIARSVAEGGSEAAAKDAIAKGVARTATGAAVTYPSSLGQVLSNQHEQTGDYNLPAAAGLAVPYSLLNQVGIEGAIARRGFSAPNIQNRVLRASATGVMTGVGETIGETGQAFTENLAKKSVDGTYDLTGEDALNNLKESAVGGFALGKAFGTAGGLISKSPNSIIGNSTQEESSTGTSGISQAVNSSNQTVNIDQAQIVADAHAERIKQESAQQAAAAQQVNVEAQKVADANLQAQQQQLAQQEAAKQKTVDASRAVVFDKFGGQPILNAKGVEIGMTFLGKNYYKGMEAKLSEAVNKVVQDEAAKPELNHHVEYAYLDAFRNNNADKPALTPSSLATKAEPFLAGVTSIEDVVDRIDAEIKKEEGKKGKASQATVGFLQNFKDNLLGEENGSQQQAATGMGAVSEQGQPVNGLLQSGQLESLQSGTQPGTANNVQNDGSGAQGSRVLSTDGNASIIDGSQTGQVNGQIQTSGQQAGGLRSVNPRGQGQNNVPASTLGQTGIGGDGGSSQTQTSGTQTTQSADGAGSAQEKTLTQVVVDEILDLVISPVGWKGENLRKYKDFLCAYINGARNETLKNVEAWNKITPDQAKKWNAKAKTFLVDNASGIGKALEEVAAKHDMSIEELYLMAFASDSTTSIEDNGVALGEGQSVTQASTQDDEQKFVPAKQDAQAADQMLTESDGELDSRDLASESSGISTYAGRKGASIQEQFNGTETVQAKYLRLANQQEDALNNGNDEEVARLQEELDKLIADARKLDEKNKAKVRASTGVKAEQKDTKKERDLWNKQAKTFKLPNYDSLPVAAKADWMLAVKSGKTGLAAMNKVYEENQEYFKGNGVSSEGQEASLNEIAGRFPVVNKALQNLAAAGVLNSLGAVDTWATTNDENAADGGYIANKDGTAKITLHEDTLAEGSNYTTSTIRHEIGHAVDLAAQGGVYSAQKEFDVVIQDGKVVPVGVVMREMHKLFKSDAGWDAFLEYPFDHKSYPKLANNPVRVRKELFAQLFSVYTHAALKEKLKIAAPQTYKFMSEVIDDIRAEKEIATKTTEVFQRRAIAFSQRATAKAEGIGSVQPGRESSEQQGQSYDQVRADVDKLIGSAKEVIDDLPATWQAPVRAVHNTFFGSKAIGLGLMITEDIAQLAKKYMKSVTKFVDVQHERNQIITEKERELTSIRTTFQDLDRSTRSAVNKIIAESTRDGIWAFDPKIEGVVPNVALSARFKALPKEAQQVIRNVFDYGRKSLADKQATIRNKIEEAYADKLSAANEEEAKFILEDKAKMTRQFSSILNLNTDKPYAPFKRFGSFVVVAKSAAYLQAERDQDTKWIRDNQSDENHYVVEFAETMGEAKEMYKTLAGTKKFDGGMLEKPFKKSEARQALYSGTDLYKGFAKLKRVIANEKGDGLDKGSEMMAKLEAMVNEMYLLSLAESSARKSELQRKTISGFNRDMMRSFFTQGMADAHYIASLKTSDKALDAMVEMQKEAGGNKAEAYPYLNELMAREAQSLQVREPSILDGANRMAGHWFLTFSPSFYLQQITQTYVLSLPWLAGRYNYFKSSRALAAAYKEIMPLVKDAGLKDHIDFTKAPSDVQEMLKTLVGRGRIDIGIEAELYDHRSDTTNPVSAAFDKTTNTLRGTINRIEAVNRAVASIAAYRLEMAKSGDKAKAIDAADKVVHITHGSYDGFNTPRLFNQNAVTRSITQFRRFQVIQLSMLVRTMHQAVKGGSDVEKAMARKQLMFLVAHTMALGGMKGMPFFAVAAVAYNLIKSVFGDDDDPEDLEAWLRSHGGILLARGIPANFGVDLSGKLGMGNTFSILPYTDVDLTSRDGYSKAAIGLMGPFAGGLLPKMADGVGYLAGGQYYKGMEQLLPNGLSAGMKAVRFATEGVTMKNGDMVVSPEEIGFTDTVFQALGLPTTKMTERQYLQGEVIKYDKFYKERTAEIKKDYVEAYRKNDTEGTAKARDDWANLQEARSKNGYTRLPLSQLIKAPMEQMKREKGVVSGIQSSKANKGFIQQRSGE